MKSLIAAAMLLALTFPAHAAKADPKDFSLIDKWRDNFWVCRNTVEDKACAEEKRLQKKLNAKWYCTYGRGNVGRLSRDHKHCYEIDNYIPSVE